MGNQVSHRPSDGGTGKVILSDGTLHKYDKPLTVAELMLEYPQQVVVEFQPTTNGKRPTPLPADKKLETDKLYIMLPMRRGKPGSVSSEEVRRILVSANAVLKSKTMLSSYTGFLPLFARICPVVAGNGGYSSITTSSSIVKKKDNNLVDKSQEMWKTGFFNQGLVVEEEEEDGEAGSRPDFLSRQLSGKNSWKPSLDTIKEKSVKAKIRHWLL